MPANTVFGMEFFTTPRAVLWAGVSSIVIPFVGLLVGAPMAVNYVTPGAVLVGLLLAITTLWGGSVALRNIEGDTTSAPRDLSRWLRMVKTGRLLGLIVIGAAVLAALIAVFGGYGLVWLLH